MNSPELDSPEPPVLSVSNSKPFYTGLQQHPKNDDVAPETVELVRSFLSRCSLDDVAIISALSRYHYSYLERYFPSQTITDLREKVRGFLACSPLSFSDFRFSVHKIRDAYLQTLLPSFATFLSLLDPEMRDFLEEMYMAENFDTLARIQATHSYANQYIDPQIVLFMRCHHINFFEFRTLALQVFQSNSSI